VNGLILASGSWLKLRTVLYGANKKYRKCHTVYGKGKEEIQRGRGHKDEKGQEREECGRGKGKKSEGG
jgi:hypothetical protein